MLIKPKARNGAKSRSGGSAVWHCRVMVNGRLYQFSTGERDKNKARHREHEFVTAKRKELPTATVSPTLNDFSAQFINDGIVGRVSPGTYTYYTFNWLVLMSSPLADLQLTQIDRAAIDSFVAWRRKQRVSATTVNHNLRCLRRALHLAAEWDLITKVPRVRMLPGERQREYVISDADVKRFAAEPSMIGVLVPFLVDTGLRRGELCNLLWSNVTDKEIHITKGKSKFSRRRIPLTDRAKAILAGLERNGEKVFTDKYGNGIKTDWLSHAFHDARVKLGLPVECVLHSTRHTFCSNLGAAGASAIDIQRLAGHSDVKISMRYTHASADRLDAAIKLLNR